MTSSAASWAATIHAPSSTVWPIPWPNLPPCARDIFCILSPIAAAIARSAACDHWVMKRQLPLLCAAALAAAFTAQAQAPLTNAALKGAYNVRYLGVIGAPSD